LEAHGARGEGLEGTVVEEARDPSPLLGRGLRRRNWVGGDAHAGHKQATYRRRVPTWGLLPGGM
ncbi:MAG: hypothetical protein ACRELA_05320, partial [Candidatus Rokuibacteriota bacterium]